MSNSKRIVSVAPESLFAQEKGSFVNLRHPRHDDGALFYLCEDLSLWELQRHSSKHRSWFVGNSVKSDGSLYLITPFDPLFIAIHYLRQKNHFSTLDTVLEDSDFPDVKQLIDAESLVTRMENIADVKSSAGFKAFRFSEVRALGWLERRWLAVEEALRVAGVACRAAGVAQAACWRSAESSSDEAVRAYAAGILAEYLPADLEEKLRARVGVPAEDGEAAKAKEDGEAAKVENGENDGPAAKKRKSVAPTDDYEAKLRQLVDVRKEAAEKAAAKPKLKKEPGMQSITNFFKKN